MPSEFDVRSLGRMVTGLGVVGAAAVASSVRPQRAVHPAVAMLLLACVIWLVPWQVASAAGKLTSRPTFGLPATVSAVALAIAAAAAAWLSVRSRKR
jgi:hypothetical protein